MALDIKTRENEEVRNFVKSSLPGREVYCNYLSDSSRMHLCNRCIQEQIDNKSLQSIKLLKMFRMAEDDHTKWNEGLAEEHLDDHPERWLYSMNLQNPSILAKKGQPCLQYHATPYRLKQVQDHAFLQQRYRK